MDEKGLRIGHFVALAGALAAFASLWRPWYAIEIPQQLRDAFGSSGAIGRDPGLLGEMARRLAAALPSSLSASGWKELEGADVALCVGALAVVALVLGAAGAFGGAVRIDPARIGSLIAGVGAAGLVIVLVHVADKPGPSGGFGDYVHFASGIWIALGGCAAIVAGGLMAAAPAGAGRALAPGATAFPPIDPELPPVFTPASRTGVTSVPPPGARP